MVKTLPVYTESLTLITLVVFLFQVNENRKSDVIIAVKMAAAELLLRVGGLHFWPGNFWSISVIEQLIDHLINTVHWRDWPALHYLCSRMNKSCVCVTTLCVFRYAEQRPSSPQGRFVEAERPTRRRPAGDSLLRFPHEAQRDQTEQESV